MFEIQKRIRSFLPVVLFSILLVTGCGGGGGGGGGEGLTFVTWTDSANGQVILDSTQEPFRVEATNRHITFTDANNFTTIYTNTQVDSSARVFIGGTEVGRVTYVRADDGVSRIVAFYCPSTGFVADIFGPASSPTYDCNTGFTPVLAALGATAIETTSAPDPVSNAIKIMEGSAIQPNVDSSGWEGGEALFSQ